MDHPDPILLPRGDESSTAERPGPCAAIYILVSADHTRAKVGLVDEPDNTRRRQTDISRKRATAGRPARELPFRMAVIGEVDGLGYFDDNEDDWVKLGHQVQGMEHAVRLVLAGVTEGYDPVDYEWLVLDGTPRDDEWWADQLRQAWQKVLAIAPGWP